MLDNEENRKDLDEIGSIITNKINQPPSCSQDGFPDTVKRYTGKGSRFYFTLQLKSVESDLLHEMTPDLSMDFPRYPAFWAKDYKTGEKIIHLKVHRCFSLRNITF